VSIAPPPSSARSAFHAVSFSRTADAPAHVVVAGELDIAGVPQLDRAIRSAERDADLVAVDMRELEFIDSSGVQLLIVTDLRLRSRGSRLVVRGAQADVRWCLGLVGADRRLELDDGGIADAAPGLAASLPAA
jgi:anti-anti-sigma factor